MRLVLAPMQGVVDKDMRELLSGIGGYDRCVTEFLRVTDQNYPQKVFYRICPELNNAGLTRSGVPVYLQLLGGKPERMATNAAKAASLGVPGIDLNFGCPAKIVNRNDGGAILLKEPQRVAEIVSAVRNAVDSATPVTVKIRLGYSDTGFLADIVGGIAEAGADEICIHARTKEDGYKPPAYWNHIKPLLTQVNLPLIANGEIWTVQDARRAQIESGCQDVMLGRGALACPDLALQIKASFEGREAKPLSWHEVLEYLSSFFDNRDQWSPRYVGNRTKQWLSYLRRHYPGAEHLFLQIKGQTRVEDIRSVIDQHLNRKDEERSLECA